jgi:hypothetical protein
VHIITIMVACAVPYNDHVAYLERVALFLGAGGVCLSKSD